MIMVDCNGPSQLVIIDWNQLPLCYPYQIVAKKDLFRLSSVHHHQLDGNTDIRYEFRHAFSGVCQVPFQNVSTVVVETIGTCMTAGGVHLSACKGVRAEGCGEARASIQRRLQAGNR